MQIRLPDANYRDYMEEVLRVQFGDSFSLRVLE